ncbi:putative nuclease HARBI1 [Ixodes scapularis]
MIVCDADLCIQSIDATFPGSVHDSFVWRMSFLREAFLQGHAVRENECLLGDSGYPLEPWLMTPVPGNHAAATDEARFNRAHRSTRSVVERCIGMLKNRFRCLQRYRTLQYDPIRSCNITTACAILHNVCLYINVPEPVPEPEPVPAVPVAESSSSSDTDSDDALAGNLHDRGMVIRQRKIRQLATSGARRRLSTSRQQQTPRAPRQQQAPRQQRATRRQRAPRGQRAPPAPLGVQTVQTPHQT